MIWNLIRSSVELETLLHLFGRFHDGCLREAHIWTGDFVHPNLTMNVAFQQNTCVRLLIQRQWRMPSAIELLFEQVATFHLQSPPENYDAIIYDATLSYVEGTFYWANTPGWSPTGEFDRDATWIAAKKLSWRDASNWMGAELRYGAGDAVPLTDPPLP